MFNVSFFSSYEPNTIHVTLNPSSSSSVSDSTVSRSFIRSMAMNFTARCAMVADTWAARHRGRNQVGCGRWFVTGTTSGNTMFRSKQIQWLQHVPACSNVSKSFLHSPPPHTHTYTLKLKSKMPGKTSTKLAVTERSKDRVCRTSRLSTPACVLVGFLWFFHLAKPSPRVDQSTDCSSLRGDNPFHL